MSDYVFVRIPRTGSTSICKALNNYPDHKTAARWKERYPDWDRRFKFTIVRDPYDRFVSMWKYFIDKDLGGFISEKKYIGDLRFRPQVDYIFSSSGSMVDYIGVYESLENSWKYICEKIGMEYIKLEHLKDSGSKPFLTNEMCMSIRPYYHQDFSFLGY